MADKPVTKSEAYKALADVRRLAGAAQRAIQRGDAVMIEDFLMSLAGVASQLQTDIFDPYVGTGLRGVVTKREVA